MTPRLHASPLVFAAPGSPGANPVKSFAAIERPSQKYSHGDRADDGSVWSVVFRSGLHLSPYADDGRSVLDSRKAIIDMVENHKVILEEGWHGAGRGIPFRVDPDHSMGGWLGGNAEALAAAGEILELAYEELPTGDLQMLARTLWTDMGRKALEVFHSCSVEFWMPNELVHRAGPMKGEPIDGHILTGIVLTNHPMVVGMPSVAASVPQPARGTRAIPKEHPMGLKLSAAVFALLAVGEHAPEDAVNAAILNLGREVEKARATAQEKGEALQAMSADLEAVTKDRDSLRATEIKRAADLAADQGRIPKSKIPRYIELATKFGVPYADETFDIPHIKTTPRSGQEPPPSGESGERALPTVLESMDDVESLISARATELEKRLSPEAAYAAAQDEVLATNHTARALYLGRPVANA